MSINNIQRNFFIHTHRNSAIDDNEPDFLRSKPSKSLRTFSEFVKQAISKPIDHIRSVAMERLRSSKASSEKTMSRGADAWQSLKDGITQTLKGLSKGFGQGMKHLSKAMNHLHHGSVKKAAIHFGQALLHFSLQTAGTMAITLLGGILSGAQTLFGLEPPSKRLNQNTKDIFRGIFGDSIPLDQIRIKTGAKNGLFSLFGQNRPFTFGHVIYMKDTNAQNFNTVLLHEMVHVWQNQQQGPSYMLDSLFSQAFGNAYDWRSSIFTTPFEDLGTEQQAEFLSDVFEAGYFETMQIPNDWFSDAQQEFVLKQSIQQMMDAFRFA